MTNSFKDRVARDWGKHLAEVLEAARRAAPNGLLVFDLDSTIFDNRPRQSRIVREFGKEARLAVLEKCAPEHWTSGWDLEAALVSCGLKPEEAKAQYKDAKAFWAKRFFTSEYCIDDVEVPGATRFLHDCLKTGSKVVYVTGRHEEMRRGSVECMQKAGMPLPDGGKVHLLMKPTLREDDDAYKRSVHAHLHKMGVVVAAFDNEPTHANDYAEKFEGAIVVHLATDHSGRPVELHPRTVSVPHFNWP